MATPTKAATEALEKVNDQLECAICLQPYTEPKLLPCFHVFCKHCLTKLVVKSRDESRITCPQCRRPTPLPPSGLAGLQSAFHVHHLFDIRDTLEKVKEPQKVPCDNLKCNKAMATGYCRDCGKFVCGKCTMAHEFLDELGSHQIVSIADIQADTTSLVPPKKKVMYCPRHPENPLKIYCETCQELICIDCTIGLHPREGHQYNLVADVFPKHRDDIVAHLKPVRQHLQTVNKALQSLDARKNEISDQRQAIEAEIHGRIDQLHQVLDQRRAELVGQLDQLTQQNLKNLAAQKDQTELLQTQLSSCLEYVEGSLKTGTEGEILAMKAPVVRQIQQIVPEVNPVTLQPHEVAKMLLVENDGPKLTETCRTLAVIISMKVKALGKPVKVMTDLRGPRGTTTNSKGMVLVAENLANCVSVFTPEGEKVQSFGSEGNGKGQFKCPCDVTVDRDDNVYVTDTHNHRIQKFTPNGKYISSVGSRGGNHLQFQFPVGIGFNCTNSKLYVCDVHNHRVQVFDINFAFSNTFGTEGDENGHFKSPYAVAFDGDGNVYIADSYNHRVQVFTAEGQYLRQFGSEGSGGGQLSWPTSIAIDKDRVYVTEKNNHRVSLFTTTGKFVHVLSLGTKGQEPGQMNEPRGVTVDQNSFVLVSDTKNNRIQIY